MAYGDDRSELASDTFDSSIDANWNVGDGDWTDLVFVTGGHIETIAGGGGGDASIRRNGETYADDQYSRTTVQVHTGSDRWIGASVRMAAGADESAYAGYAQTFNDKYEIAIFDSTLRFISLATIKDPGTEIPHSAGDIVTIEIRGKTIRLGSDTGGTDVQKVTITDNTITSGDPGVVIFTLSGGEADARATAWSGGDIAVAAGGRIMSSLARAGGLAAFGGIAGNGGGLAARNYAPAMGKRILMLTYRKAA